jgi:hypothetical protein
MQLLHAVMERLDLVFVPIPEIVARSLDGAAHPLTFAAAETCVQD